VVVVKSIEKKSNPTNNYSQNTHKIKINPNHNPARMLSTQITNPFFAGGWNAFASVREKGVTDGEQGYRWPEPLHRSERNGTQQRWPLAMVRERVSGRGRGNGLL
jgi:hypothetical protein